MAAYRVVLAESDQWLAGSAVSWRRLSTANRDGQLVGIMTGSWTLPDARGRGCFARLIELSREACVDAGATLLLAFVTETNASRRQLEKAGAAMIPSLYIRSSEEQPLPAETSSKAPELALANPSDEAVDQLYRRHRDLRARTTRFVYSTPQSWRSQFVERTSPVQLLSHPELGTAVVERHPEFDRMLASIPLNPEGSLALEAAVCHGALTAGRRFFGFTTRVSDQLALVDRCSLDPISGFLTVLPAAGEIADVPDGWFIEGGDRV